jgi:hypothetical protein
MEFINISCITLQKKCKNTIKKYEFEKGTVFNRESGNKISTIINDKNVTFNDIDSTILNTFFIKK